jgi:hypothetical protein
MEWMMRLFEKKTRYVPPQPVAVRLTDLKGAVQRDDYFVRPDFRCLQQWVDQHYPQERYRAWWTLVKQWLEGLREDLPEKYGIYHSDHFTLLSPRSARVSGYLLDFAERSRQKISILLGEPEWLTRMTGPHVVLNFDELDHYLAYKSHFGSPGEYGMSQGCFFPRGYRHIALRGHQQDQLESTLAHELSHLMTSELPLPLWLDEGLAQAVPRVLGCAQDHLLRSLDAKRVAQHRKVWTEHGLNEFWSGRSFSRPDERQELSYELADILTRVLLETADLAPRFWPFVQTAHRANSGQAAALEYLGRGLDSLAGGFLGPGDWTWRLEQPESCPVVPGRVRPERGRKRP